MRIIVDAHGGDNAPLAVLQGCVEVGKKYSIDILLIGNKETIKHCAAEHSISLGGCEILAASAENSISIGLKALAAGKGEAFVSAGSTGQLVMEANRIIGRQAGIHRTAIAAVVPTIKEPFVLIDSGANLRCTPEILLQFAQMGAKYASDVLGVKTPRVGLLNIGTEPDKGDELHRDTYALLKGHITPCLYSFIGNVEAREVPFGCCDVLVADGFSGNIFLKAYEGTALAMLSGVKEIYRKNFLTKISSLLISKGLIKLRNHMDYSQYGGAPLLGFNAVVIKAHGSSNAQAICNAIHQAKKMLPDK